MSWQRWTEGAVLKSIAAFLNSPYGGTLLIGVEDDPETAPLGAGSVAARRRGEG